jgi:hypothetical protein
VLLTHETEEQAVDAAIAGITALPFVVGSVTKLRVEHLT